jgi:catalase
MHGQTNEFIVNQYRHCKTILALGASARLLEEAGAVTTLPSGAADPGVLTASGDKLPKAAERFIAAVGKHRHPVRESDPPMV